MAKNTTARIAENYVAEYFRHRGVELIRIGWGEAGYDFRNADSTIFIEVKGSTALKLSEVLFRYFTNGEYEHARKCKREKKKFEIHLVIGIPDAIQHYVIPGARLLENARPEVSWYLSTTKDFKQYKIDPTALNTVTNQSG